MLGVWMTIHGIFVSDRNDQAVTRSKNFKGTPSNGSNLQERDSRAAG
jgi:hypothetical protein